MRRWNGWGDENHHHPLPKGADAHLERWLGASQPTQDAHLADVAKRVPSSRLAAHPLVTIDPIERIRHARGQSFPDWVALRSGHLDTLPDGVAYPLTDDDVKDLIAYAKSTGIRLIPYGGGTSVAGHINPISSDTPVLTVDMGRMNQLLALDSTSQLATFGAGINGPDLEAQLRAHGLTLGHFPQSFEYATLGGWIATRSSGQQSLHYGRIERLFAGGTVQTPLGEIRLPATHPASATGPDLREVILGSEGRMGIITEATVRVSPQPEQENFYAVFFPSFDHGMAAVREIVQARVPLSMLRLSTATETMTNLALAGKPSLIHQLERVLAWRGITDQKAMLIYGYTGTRAIGRVAIRKTHTIAKKHSGVHLGIGKIFGETWRKGRFKTPYLRNTLWEKGYGVDTLETATDWTTTPRMIQAIESALQEAMAAFDEPIHVFTHLSHLYPYGTSIYTSYVFRLHPDADVMLARWHAMKSAASEAIVRLGGTISHQHGVGIDHAPYLQAEKGHLGMKSLGTLIKHFDPDGLMNPGKLINLSGG
ncbi:MAG: FAD-binding oxidoreductase [Phototrophicales bacterium]